MKKIRNKILFTMMLLTLLPVLLIGGYSAYTTTEVLREIALKSQQNQLVSNKQNLESRLKNVERDLFFLNSSSAVQLYLTDKQSLAAAEKMLERFANLNAIYSSIRLLDHLGQELVHIERQNGAVKSLSDISELLDQSGTGYFTEASRLEKNDVYISPLELRRVNGDIIRPYQSTIRYASAVSSNDNQVIGVLVLELDADYLIQQTGSEKSLEWRNLLVDTQGYPHFQEDLDNGQEGVKKIDHQTSVFEGSSSVLSAIKGSKDYQLMEGDTEISLSIPVSLGEGSLGYLISIGPKALLFKPLRDYLSISLIIVAICLLLSFLFAIILANSLSEPLFRLTEKVKSFSQGDLKTPIETDVNNEIGDLSQAIELLRKSMVILMKRSRKA